jgi:hypothetical protein
VDPKAECVADPKAECVAVAVAEEEGDRVRVRVFCFLHFNCYP